MISPILGVQHSTLLVGTDFMTANASDAVAKIEDSSVDGYSGVSVTATNAASLSAQMDSNSTTKAEAFQGASAQSAQGVLSSNMLAGEAKAYIQNAASDPAEAVQSANGAVSVVASDEVMLNSKTVMVTGASKTNDLGIGLLNNLADQLLYSHDFTTKSGSQSVEFGNIVLVASDYGDDDNAIEVAKRGKKFQYLGQTGNHRCIGDRSVLQQ